MGRALKGFFLQLSGRDGEGRVTEKPLLVGGEQIENALDDTQDEGNGSRREEEVENTEKNLTEVELMDAKATKENGEQAGSNFVLTGEENIRHGRPGSAVPPEFAVRGEHGGVRQGGLASRLHANGRHYTPSREKKRGDILEKR